MPARMPSQKILQQGLGQMSVWEHMSACTRKGRTSTTASEPSQRRTPRSAAQFPSAAAFGAWHTQQSFAGHCSVQMQVQRHCRPTAERSGCRAP